MKRVFIIFVWVVIFLIGLVVIMQTSSSVYTKKRDAELKIEKAYMEKGTSFDTFISKVTHAQHPYIIWDTDTADPVRGTVQINFLGRVMERPIDRTGKPVNAISCTIQYKMFMFSKKVLVIDFDENNNIKSVEEQFWAD